MLNAYSEAIEFELPPVPAESQQDWRRCIDNALALPTDIYPGETVPSLEEATSVVQSRSIVFLALGRPADGRRCRMGVIQ
jgi:isoamylase